MIYIHPAEKAQYLEPKDAKKLLKTIQGILKETKKNVFSSKNLDDLTHVLTRLLHTSDNLAIYEKRFIYVFSKKQPKISKIENFHQLKKDEPIYADFLNYLPNEPIAQACYHVAQAIYRTEESKKEDARRSLEELIKEVKALDVLSKPLKALEAFAKRWQQCHEEELIAQGKNPKNIKAPKSVLREIQTRKSAAQDNLLKARFIRDAALSPKSKKIHGSDPQKQTLFDKDREKS